MVPLLSSLLSPIYPGLRNHPEVERRGWIPGLVSPLFFINHSHAEHQSQVLARIKKGLFGHLGKLEGDNEFIVVIVFIFKHKNPK